MTLTLRQLLRAAALGLLAAGGMMGTGCATKPAGPVLDLSYPSEALTGGLSPKAEVVGPFEGLRRAEAYVKAHPGSDYAVGAGASMLPLYKDHTVLITENRPLEELQRGMTVVFVGDSGFPVAHTLVARTPRGWIAMGLGKKAPDRTLVRHENYRGVVVRAFEPSENPMAAILRKRPVAGVLAAAP